MSAIVGYTDRASVEPGGTIGCHVSLLAESASAEADYQARLVRIVGREGGEERVEPVPSDVDGRYVAAVQATTTGSHAVAAVDFGGRRDEELRVEVSFMPTLLAGKEQRLLSVCDADAGDVERLALAVDSERRPVLIVGGPDRDETRFVLAVAVEPGRWYRMTGGYRAGEAFGSVSALGDDGVATERAWALPGSSPIAEATVYLAAGQDGARIGGHFTGRLEDPALKAGDRLVARWDLGQGPDTFSIRDISGNENHGELFGLPARACTGSNWDGGTLSFRDAPDQYTAIHFFEDAIEDAGWPAAFSLEVPGDLRSGLYAFVLECEGDRETVPFVVTPPPVSDAEMLLVLPTATYMAYSNTRFPWEKVNYEVQRERTVELGRGERILLEHPEFGASSYDQYLDGSNVTYVSWRRPNLDMRAHQCRGEAFPSDLRLLDWLERNGYRYDVCTDGDLDRQGAGLLERYRVAMTGTHPEYASGRAYEALEEFLANGGRLAVLGGDVFTWLVAFSDERPWVMEVRKPDNRPTGSRAAAEAHLALTGEYGGEPERPRPAERLLGTGSASMGFDEPRPYERLPGSDLPEVHFIFAGVDDRTIGGDVVFQEWDNTEDVTGFAFADGKPIVLARSSRHSVTTRWFGAGKRRSHAEMVFFATDGGGAAFSVSSMGWCLCLDREDVSRITANVLDRFLDPSPLPR